MSDELQGASSPTSSSEALHTDYSELRDGQLQIVEVTPFDKSDDAESDDVTETIHIRTEDGGARYVQLLDAGGGEAGGGEGSGGLVQLDLLNLTLVRCGEGDDEEYRLVSNDDAVDCGQEYITPDTTVILQSSEADDDCEDAQESYVMMTEEENEDQDQESYVMVETGGGGAPLVYLQSDLQPAHVKPNTPEREKPSTTYEILSRAKALHKAKHLLQKSMAPQTGRGRRRKHHLPSPSEILASPSFKLFLYSCKLCQYKCNAVSDLTKHKNEEHSAGSVKGRASNGSRAPASTLQCARCPYRGGTHFQLIRHVQDHHMGQPSAVAGGEGGEDEEVLVCGACGFESPSRAAFRAHVDTKHALRLDPAPPL